jgi:hypothetical protein
VTIGLLPLAAVVFLAWIAIKSILAAPAAQNHTLLGFVAAGAILLFVARFVLRSPFFQIKRENWTPEGWWLRAPRHAAGKPA